MHCCYCEQCPNGLKSDDWRMSLKIIISQSLGTPLGNNSSLIFLEVAILISLLCKHKLVGDQDHAFGPVYKFPGTHALQLVKLCMNHSLPFWPLWRCLCFMKAMAVVIWYDCKSFLSDLDDPSFFLIWKGVIHIFVIQSYSPCPPRLLWV